MRHFKRRNLINACGLIIDANKFDSAGINGTEIHIIMKNGVRHITHAKSDKQAIESYNELFELLKITEIK